MISINNSTQISNTAKSSRCLHGPKCRAKNSTCFYEASVEIWGKSHLKETHNTSFKRASCCNVSLFTSFLYFVQYSMLIILRRVTSEPVILKRGGFQTPQNSCIFRTIDPTPSTPRFRFLEKYYKFFCLAWVVYSISMEI